MPLTLLQRLPSPEYPITRNFESFWVTAFAYIGGPLVVILLCIANTALVGYEPITVFHHNFNVTQDFWFHRFMPFTRQTPGTLCDPRVFSVGESLVTNVSLFKWDVEGVYKPNAGEFGFSYEGGTLDDCDVHQIVLNGDLRTRTLDGRMWFYCNCSSNKGNGRPLELTGVTNFMMSPLPARRTNFRRMTRSAAQDSLALTVQRLFAIAAFDWDSRLYEAYARTPNGTSLVSYSLLAKYRRCPASLGTTIPCALNPPTVNITVSAAIHADNTIHPSEAMLSHRHHRIPDPTMVYNLTDPGPIKNLLQLARAAARIDLGNPARNNFLLNPQATESVLASSFPETPVVNASQSLLYSSWKTQINPANNETYPALRISGPSTWQATFICHLYKQKSPGTLITSVLVATLSMSYSAWGLGLLIASSFVKKEDGDNANHCQAGSENEGEGDSRPASPPTA